MNGDLSGDPTIDEYLNSDYGGSLQANSTVYDQVDNGQTQGGTVTPGWLQSLASAVGVLGTAASTVAPLINGRPANSPGNPAQQPNASGTVPTKFAFPSWLLWVALAGVGAIVAVLLVKKL